MAGRRGKGLLITTGTFTNDARAESRRDGHHLAACITAERQHNKMARETRRKYWEECYFGPRHATGDEEPPPF